MSHLKKIHEIKASDLRIKNLGECKIHSPVNELFQGDLGETRFVDDESDKVVFNDRLADIKIACGDISEIPALEIAGPRRNIFFDGAQTRCAIVTCGGLCPGMNDVIRAIVMHAYYRYGVKKIFGVPYGYEGFIPKYGHKIRELTPEDVLEIHTIPGSILGTSRGDQDGSAIVDWLQQNQVNILFVIGGDGTLQGADRLCDEIARRGAQISIVGVPKTIDNDIMWIDKSFGFDTAFTAAVDSIHCAHAEARGVYNGIGLVKLMGRESGFITCYAALATNEANAVLIPEVPFKLEGKNGLLAWLQRRIEKRHHAVIVVAEGVGQELFKETHEVDASGNKIFHDIGILLKQKIAEHFKQAGVRANMKYIDPSYIIRGVPAAPKDRIFCARLGQHAVHAAMAGKTAVLIGRWHMNYVHLPIPLLTSGRNHVDASSDLWLSVVESTGQPLEFK